MRLLRLLPGTTAITFALVTAGLLVGGTPSLATGRDLPGQGTTVKVVVASTSPTTQPSSPSPTATSSTGSPSPSSSAAPSTSSVPTGAPTNPEPSTTPIAGPGDEQSLGGVLYVSGLAWTYTPSINPLAGSLDLHFTVRNVSTQPATGSARMWLSGIFDIPVGQVVEVPVVDLKPGETRVISGRIDSLSQWTFVTASTTFTPPPILDGTPLTPLTRNTTVLYVPWFMLLVIAVLSVALFEVRRRRLAREATEVLVDAATAAAGGTHP